MPSFSNINRVLLAGVDVSLDLSTLSVWLEILPECRLGSSLSLYQKAKGLYQKSPLINIGECSI